MDSFLKINITSAGRNSRCSLSNSAVSTLSTIFIHAGKLAHDPSVGADPGNLRGGGALLSVQSHPLLGHT